jgi:hypothetical protein
MKFMSLSVDIQTSVVRTKMAFPSAFILDKAMPILVQVYQSSTSLEKKSTVLSFVAQILKHSAEPGKQRPLWYDNFLYISNEALITPGLDLSGALALTNGGHFLEQINSEQIFDQLFCMNSNHYELLYTCIRLSKGSRPTQDQLKSLYVGQKGQTLAVVYRNEAYFESDLGRILSLLDKEENIDFGLELLQEIFRHHREIKTTVTEEVLKAIVKSTERPKMAEFLQELSSRCDSSFGPIFEQILTQENPKSQNLLQPLLTFAQSSLLNSLNSGLLKALFDRGNAHLKAAFVNKVKNPDLILNLEESWPEEEVAWIAKGLLYRMALYPKAKLWIDKILENTNISEAFAILVGPCEAFLECLPSRAALARQKVFSLTKPALIKAIKANKANNASSHLKALICQLPYVPKFALANELTDLLPLLLNGLQSKDDEKLALASLTSVKDLLDHEPKNFGSFLSTFLPMWLDLSCDMERPIQVRIKALECLKAASKAESKDVVPHKKEVVKRLTPTLGDHKRLVRQAAAAARNHWCMS